MSILRIVTANLLGLLVLTGAGCSVSRSTVISAFKSDFSCDKSQIQIDHPDKSQRNVYRATGCNRRVTYRCTGDYGALCDRVGEPEDVKLESGLIDLPPKGQGTRPKTNDGTPP